MQDELSRPDVHEWLGVRYKTILSSVNTGGAMSIVDTSEPGGERPPRHVHEREDEVFVIQSSDASSGSRVRPVKGAGQAVFVPRGREHTFRVVSDIPCRHLVILTPGWLEGFFADMARGGFRIPEDMEQVNASAARHNRAGVRMRRGRARAPRARRSSSRS